MLKRLGLLLTAAALCLALAARAPRAQTDSDPDGREADERAATVEERRGALQSQLEAARRLRQAGEWAGAARALNRAGRLRFRLSLPEEAASAHREALALAARARDARAEADSLNGLGAAYTRLGRCAEAEPHLARAAELGEREGYAEARARALLLRSGCQNYYDHALALRTAEEALALWEAAGGRRGAAEAHSSAAYYQLAQNNLAEAERHQEAALAIWRELGSAAGQADALISLGFTEYRKGAWQSVFSYLTRAQGLLDERAEPYKMGQINAGLAEAYIESGSPELGLDKYRLALDYYRAAQSPRSVAVMFWGIGKAHLLLGEYPQALESLRRGLADAGAIGEVTVVAMCHEYIGRTQAAAGDPEAALSHLGAARRIFERASNPMEVARVSALAGRVHERRGRIESARAHYRAALDSFRALSDRLNESATLYALGSLELRLDNLGAAEDYLRRSIEVTEGVRRVSTGGDLTAAFSATVHDRYQAYVECLMRRHAADPSRGLDALAFESSESARARSLAERLRETGTIPGLDPPLAEREAALRQSLRAKEDAKVTLLGGRYQKKELEALDAELARLEAEYKALDEVIRARHTAYSRAWSPGGWTLRRVQQQVVADDETLLLEYSLGAERSYVWAVTRDAVQSYELPPRAQIEGAAGRVYRLLAAKPDEGGEGERAAAELDEVARELSRMVLAPAAEALRGRRRVVVVADGALDYVPFQLLSSPAAEGDGPLVSAYEVVYAPSASVLGQLREEAERRRAPSKTLAAFGDPVFPSNYLARRGAGGGVEVAGLRRMEGEDFLSRLRDVEVDGDTLDPATARQLFFAGVELENLREAAAGGDPLIASGFEATSDRLRGTDLSEFAILHIATHGLLDPKRPEKSGLLLSTVDAEGRARAGFVGLRDIYSLRTPVGLVVLSACRTALGKEVRGEGMIGLTRGFMYAGASGVVSSLWKVNDEATSELMRRFYENMLRRGMTPAAALGAAQNSIRQEPRWRSPYYWAAFTLQGEYRQVLRPAPAHPAAVYAKAAVLAAALLLLSLAAWAAWRLRRRRAAAA
ncbi:MAG TPA: CHAT domain-containing tetratricopeptide repeat protein [Pyrinomonadaceae bacterium]|jgi:CHAT domain-containing protein